VVRVGKQRLKSNFQFLIPKLPKYGQLAFALMGGVLMGVTPAPVNAWFLAWVALVPLWILVARPSSLKAKLAFGFVWGLGFHGLALSWITGLHPLTWMGVPWLASLAIALFCWLFITAWGALLVAIWAGSFKLLEQSSLRTATIWFLPLARILVGTAVWCALEGIWSSGTLWWTSLSYTQSPHNLLILHLGQLTGPSATTAAIVAVNGLLAEAWLSSRSYATPSPSHSATTAKLYLAIAAILLLSLHLLGLSLYNRPLTQPPEAAVRVGLIQGNVPTRIKLYEEGVRRAFNAYMTGYDILANQNVDIVFTPEGALPIYWVPSTYQSNPVYQSVLNRGVPLVLGSFGRRDDQITQSLFAIAANGEIVGRYNKVKLVPLGEYIPFEQFLGSLINRLSPVEASMIPGELEQQFDTPVGRAIAGICYESAFSRLFRVQAANGGEFILTASNNDPYSRTMMFQHHAQDVMRAIETDRWAARVTNTGYSGIVDPHGRTRWLSDNNIYEIHADTIYRRPTRSLYVQWGDWLTPLLLILGLTVGLGIRR
jgi:apolipoprotein N-acyltransferase